MSVVLTIAREIFGVKPDAPLYCGFENTRLPRFIRNVVCAVFGG